MTAAGRLADFHCHLVPGVDDGSETMRDSLHSIGRMIDAGIARIITTPHLAASAAGRVYRNGFMHHFDRQWARVRDRARTAFPDLELRCAFEVRLDAPFPVHDERLRLGGTRFVLVEVPDFRIHAGIAALLADIVRAGLVPVVAHPERYRGIDRDLEVLRRWKAIGAHLQGNYGSLVGQSGKAARAIVLRLLAEGLLDYLCSDFHGQPGYTLYTGPGRDEVRRQGGMRQLELLGNVNPGRLFEGRPPLPVPSLELRAPPKEPVEKWLE